MRLFGYLGNAAAQCLKVKMALRYDAVVVLPGHREEWWVQPVKQQLFTTVQY